MASLLLYNSALRLIRGADINCSLFFQNSPRQTRLWSPLWKLSSRQPRQRLKLKVSLGQRSVFLLFLFSASASEEKHKPKALFLFVSLFIYLCISFIYAFCYVFCYCSCSYFQPESLGNNINIVLLFYVFISLFACFI